MQQGGMHKAMQDASDEMLRVDDEQEEEQAE